MGWFPPEFWTWFVALPWSSFFTVLNSFLAIAIASVVGYFGWKHNRNAVRPYLEFVVTMRRNPQPEIFIHLENKGVGPAIITDFEVHVNGKPRARPDQPLTHEMHDDYMDKINRRLEMKISYESTHGEQMPPAYFSPPVGHSSI